MGPDLMFFLQDQATKELLLNAKQSKVITPDLDFGKWRSAIISVTPRFRYTRVSTCNLSHVLGSYSGDGERPRYAPKNYSMFGNDLSKTLEQLLGPTVCI